MKWWHAAVVAAAALALAATAAAASPPTTATTTTTTSSRGRRAAPREPRDCAAFRDEIPFLEVAPESGVKGSFCNGDCCGPEAEASLRKHGQKELAKILKGYSKSLQGSLSSISTTLQEYINEMAYQSENVTQNFAQQMYKSIAFDSIATLYKDIRTYVETGDSGEVFPASPIDIKSSVSTFFENLFPIAYKQALDLRDLTFEYKSCLRKYYNELQPFGETPRQMGQALSKSLEATRLLFQALEMGVQVLNSSDAFMDETNRDNADCYDALLKMTYCPKCQGLSSHKPCSGYCLNVLRGCLSRYVVELDSPWNGYVEGIERLMTTMKQQNNEAMVNAGLVIKGIDAKLSDAIMYIWKKREDLDSRAKRNCGPPKFAEKELPPTADAASDSSTSATTSSSGGGGAGGGKQRLSAARNGFSPLPVAQINGFLTSIAQSRNFYDNLAENLCRDDFAETRDKRCWNGERIGEYTKTVVDANLGMQKYNPEVKQRTVVTDVRVAALADKLRHVHQMVISSLGGVSLPEADNYVQQGDDPDGGSGSGDRESEDDDNEYSGSGERPIVPPVGPRFDTKPTEKVTPMNAPGGSSAASILTPSVCVTILVTLRMLLRDID